MCIYSEEDRVGEAELVRQVLRFCLTEHTDGDAVLLQLAQAILGLLDGQALSSFRICIHDYIHTRIHIYSILRLGRCEKLCQANIARANCLLARSLACSISLSRARALSLSFSRSLALSLALSLPLPLPLSYTRVLCTVSIVVGRADQPDAATFMSSSTSCILHESRPNTPSRPHHGTYRVSKGKIKDEVSAIRKWSIKATLRSTYPVPKHKG